MKIAFLGDSITEGKLGVSYFAKVQEAMVDDELINLGKNGDTVHSLYTRIKHLDFEEYDIVFVLIGINDIFGKVNRAHRLVRVLQRQTPAKDLDTFLLNYKELVDHLLKMNSNLVLISPLLLGEDIESAWNEQVREMEVEIELLSRNYGLPYLDVQRQMYDYLEDKKQSNYLPLSIRQVSKDLLTLKTDELIDKMSKERELHFTLDGVHLNSKGAQYVADAIVELIKTKKEVK